MQRAPHASFQQMHDQGAAKKSTGAEDHGTDQKGIPTVRNKRRLGHQCTDQD